MSKFEQVKCEYTGGGVWVYSALYNGEVWLYGGLDWYFGSYSIPGAEIEDEHDADYDAYWKTPSVPYPTWNEILDSLREVYRDDPNLCYMERQLRNANPDMDERCIGDDAIPNDSPDDASPDRERLETVGAFLDVFDEYLEEKGYSTDDTCLLADKIEELLRRFGVLKE